MNLGISGFTPSGTPKTLLREFAEYVSEENLDIELNLYSGASIASSVEEILAIHGITKNRYPYQSGKTLNQLINRKEAELVDLHLSNYAHQMNQKFLGEIDVGIVEVSEITEEGHVVLTGSVGVTPQLLKTSKKLILEVNTQTPSLYGIHDLFYEDEPPSNHPGYSISSVSCRVGKPYLEIPDSEDRILGIVEGVVPDDHVTLFPPDQSHLLIADFIIDFLESEINRGRIRPNFTLQSGVGNIANAVLEGLKCSDFENLELWSEVIQDNSLDLIDLGKIISCTGTSLTLTDERSEIFYRDFEEKYRDVIVLRPSFVTNGCYTIRRLGVVAMNTPLEFDIFGHANSTHLMGSKIVNGMNSMISICHSPSVRGDGNEISCIVPMCSHIDHTEHDIDVFVTEQGLADLRGLGPVDRAREIIRNCVHPEYKDQLTEYLDLAVLECTKKGMGHQPFLIDKVFKMYQNYSENGTMKLESWE